MQDQINRNTESIHCHLKSPKKNPGNFISNLLIICASRVFIYGVIKRDHDH